MATKWDGSLCCFIVCQLGLSPMVFGNFCHFLSISKYSALNCVEFYSNIENPSESKKIIEMLFGVNKIYCQQYEQ